jgi:hypothetical protein
MFWEWQMFGESRYSKTDKAIAAVEFDVSIRVMSRSPLVTNTYIDNKLSCLEERLFVNS